MFELIVFLCGMSVMIIELAGVRIITPFLGGTHIIYTSVIGVIMLSLSLGYFLGGKLSIKNAELKQLSKIIFYAGLYILALAFFQFSFLRSISNVSIHLILKAIICSFIMFFPPSVLLGSVSPYILQIVLNKKLNPSGFEGDTAGKLYAISTIGSITGVFLCGFYLIIKFGIDEIFFALSFILFLCAYFCVFEKNFKKLTILYLIMCLFSLISLVYFKNNRLKVFENSIYSETTLYDYINIKEYKYGKKTVRALSNHFSSIFKNVSPENYSYEYIKMFSRFFENKKERNNVLILGNATGSLVTGLLHYCSRLKIKNVQFDIVELNKSYTKIGAEFFGLPADDPRLQFFYEDARTFLNKKSTKKYDLIYYDIYSSDYNYIFPYYLVTIETFKEIYNKLSQNGIFVMNIIGKRGTEKNKTKYIDQIYTQLKQLFNYVKLYETHPKSSELRNYNYIFAGYKNSTDKNAQEIQALLKNKEVFDLKETGMIFTDNYSPVEKFLF